MIEVGEYIRTRKGITKIEKVNNKKGCALCENSLIVNIKTHKHSKNIIDLIEVGDIVEYVDDDGEYIKDFIVKKLTPVSLISLIEYLKAYCKVIAILTHEQYEQNCYKVGDIE